MHNDDTSMRILRLLREPGDKRTGIFTSGIISIVGAWRIALFFTGSKHAGENIARGTETPRGMNCRRPFRCAMRFRATRRSCRGSKSCSRTAWRTEDGS